MDATESTVFVDKTDRNSDDDDDLEFYLYKGPTSPFALRKLPRDINTTTTITTNKAKPAANDATTTTNLIIFDEKTDRNLDVDDDTKCRWFAQSVDNFYKKYYC